MAELVADVAASPALVVDMAACAADVFLLANDAEAELAAAVADVAASPAFVVAVVACPDAVVADPEAAVADAAALIACCVTSLMLASVVESPAPPLPLYKLIVYPYLLSLSFLFLAACLVLTLP